MPAAVPTSPGRTPVEAMNVGPALIGRIAYLPSRTGKTRERVLVSYVRQVAREGMDGSGGYRIEGHVLYVGRQVKRRHYGGSALGSLVVDVEVAEDVIPVDLDS